jgi:cellulose synthase/poly-beta-1,6-N-acetylglucosamine synthase-like glycosyltransferase
VSAGLAHAVQALLVAGTVVLALPLALLALQLLTAALRGPKLWPLPNSENHRRGRVAVLVPAHNEAAGIGATVRGIVAQLGPEDRVLVVADNCSDDTAAQARAAGAQVSERTHATDRGKGYALAHGVDVLRADPPEVVMVVDADCRLSEGFVTTMAQHCQALGRPLQSLDLMESPPGAGLVQRVSEFAWRIKNQARARGAAWWGMPCPLMGTGMAFGWTVIEHAPLASASIVEDMRLGADLTIAGQAPLFVEAAAVRSHFPDSAAASDAQRKRWEHGHLGVIAGVVPRLLGRGFLRGSVAAGALALNLAVPPLALFAALVMGWSALLLVAGALIAPAWAVVGLLLPAVFFFSVLAGWWRFGRDLLRARELLSVPWYIVRKLPMYAAFALKRQTRWNRAERRKP